MKRSTTTGTIALAAALIALPASGFAQTAPPQQPPAAQAPTQPPAPQPPATPPAAAEQPAAAAQTASAEEHLAKANAALSEIQATAVTGAAGTKLTALRKHMAALGSARAPKAGATSWATDVAAIDRILTELTTPAAAGDPTPPTGATGTTGTTAGRASRAQAAITIDDATRAKLMEVRTHITAFAAAKSGTATPAAPAANPATATPPDPPMPATPPATPPSATPPATEPPVTTQPPATAQPPATTPPAEPPATASAAPAAPGKVDKEAAKRSLTEARDTLSQLTQLPEAAQLAGDARTQVAQLIANFNELITTQSEWRAAFDKVQANLTALIGAERTDESNVPPPATGTPGAVGTSGMTTVDPKIREKLVEFRSKLSAFQRAAGGGDAK